MDGFAFAFASDDEPDWYEHMQAPAEDERRRRQAAQEAQEVDVEFAVAAAHREVQEELVKAVTQAAHEEVILQCMADRQEEDAMAGCSPTQKWSPDDYCR